MKQVAHIIATLTLIGVIAGGSLITWLITGPHRKLQSIKKQKQNAQFILFILMEKDMKKLKNAGFEVYKVFNEADSSVGYSLVYSGNGFQGKIKLMIGSY
ncbi:MAG: hypothetical protein MZV64_57170 [Ignavibacteriales bacterium]|nr:hypothetical protein [Ignavibacteriales bacterium]